MHTRQGSLIISEGGGAGSFGSLGGSPTDNAALAAALEAKVSKDGDTMTGALGIGVNGASGAPALQLTGSVFSGGTATTTKPLALIEPAGATSNNWNTNGTMLGINAPSGFTGSHLSIQTNGVDALNINNTALSFAATGQVRAYGNTVATFDAGVLQLGNNTSLRMLDNADNVLAWINGGSGQHTLELHRDGDYIAAFRKGTNNHAVRVYGTYTDAANYERLALQTGAGYVECAAESAGTGSDDMDVRLTPKGLGTLHLNSPFVSDGTIAAQGYVTIRLSNGLYYDVLVRPTP
jgi:hypothetical protein